MSGALDRPTSGEILLGGQPLQASRELDRLRARHIGFVLQSFCLLPKLTALENVQFPTFEGTWPRGQRASRAKQLLTKVGLMDRLQQVPSQLSIGQRQRVAIA